MQESTYQRLELPDILTESESSSAVSLSMEWFSKCTPTSQRPGVTVQICRNGLGRTVCKGLVPLCDTSEEEEPPGRS